MGWHEGAIEAVKGFAGGAADMATSIGNKASEGIDKVKDYYTMDQTPEQAAMNAWESSKGADKWSFVGTGEEMSEEDRKDLEKRMNQAGVSAPTRTEVALDKVNKYNEEAGDKKLRRGITGALLGAGLGAAKHKAETKQSAPAVRQRSSNAGKLGTGYNPLAQGRIFTK